MRNIYVLVLILLGTLLISYSLIQLDKTPKQEHVTVPIVTEKNKTVGSLNVDKSKISFKALRTESNVTIGGVSYPDVVIQFNFPFNISGYTTYGDFEQGIVADNNAIYIYLKQDNSNQWIVKYDHYGNLLWSYKINIWLRDIWMWQDDGYVYVYGLDKNNNKFYMKINKADGSVEDSRIVYDYNQTNGFNYECFTLMKDNQTFLAPPYMLIKKDLSDYFVYKYGQSEYIIPLIDGDRIFSIYAQTQYTNGGQDFLVRLYNKKSGKIESMYFFGTPTVPDDLTKEYYYDDDMPPFWPLVIDENYGWVPIIVKTQGKSIVGEFDLLKVSRSNGQIVDVTKYILPRYTTTDGVTMVPVYYKRYDYTTRNSFKYVWMGSADDVYATKTLKDSIGATKYRLMNFRIEKIIEHQNYFELYIPYHYYSTQGITTSAILIMKIDKDSGYLYDKLNSDLMKDQPAYMIYPMRSNMFINAYYIDNDNNIYILYSIINGNTTTMYLVQTSVDTITTYNIQIVKFTGSLNVVNPNDISIKKDQIKD